MDWTVKVVMMKNMNWHFLCNEKNVRESERENFIRHKKYTWIAQQFRLPEKAQDPSRWRVATLKQEGWLAPTERASFSAISLRHILASPGYVPGTIAVNVTWMKRGFNACQTHRSIYPSIFNRFPVIQPVSSKVRHFSTFCTFLHTPVWHILASPEYASGTIAVNVTWIEREFNAGQKTHRSMCPSIFNRLRAIASYWSEIASFSYPLAFNASVWGVPIGIPGEILVLIKLESWATRQWRQIDDRLSRFDTIPACDRRTDGRPAHSYNVRQSSDAR